MNRCLKATAIDGAPHIRGVMDPRQGRGATPEKNTGNPMISPLHLAILSYKYFSPVLNRFLNEATGS